MLAQNFKTADDLGLSESQFSALSKTLVLLETGKLKLADVGNKFDHKAKRKFDGLFNMSCWGTVSHICGTIACIGGTAEIIGDVSFGNWIEHKEKLSPNLYELFYARDIIDMYRWNDITPSQASVALRSYLTTGEANWKLAVSS